MLTNADIAVGDSFEMKLVALASFTNVSNSFGASPADSLRTTAASMGVSKPPRVWLRYVTWKREPFGRRKGSR